MQAMRSTWLASVLWGVGLPCCGLAGAETDAALIARVLSDPGIVPGLEVVGRPRTESMDSAGETVTYQTWRLRATGRPQASAGHLTRSASGQRFSFYAPVPDVMPSDVLPLAELVAAADGWIERNVSPDLRSRIGPEGLGGPHRIRLGGEVEFIREFVDDGRLLPGWVSVQVRVYDGLVCAASVHPPPMLRVPEPAIPRERAAQIARQLVVDAGLQPTLELGLPYGVLQEDLRLREGRAYYRCSFAVSAPAGRDDYLDPDLPVVATVLVGGQDGKAAFHAVFNVEPARFEAWSHGQPSPLETDWHAADQYPNWTTTSDGRPALLFVSNRARLGRPPWCANDASLLLVDLDSGVLSGVVSAYDDEISPATCGGDTIVYDSSSECETVALDMRSGLRRRLSPLDERLGEAVLTPDGRWLIYVESLEDRGDALTILDLASPGRPQQLPGPPGVREVLCCSPGGEWVYFEQLTWAGEDLAEHSICRVPIGDLRHPVPQRVVTGIDQVARVSAFPDGDRLLLSDGSGLNILDVQSGQIQPLRWPALRDPDHPDGPDLEVMDPVISPDGTQVAFAGFLRLSSASYSECLYTVGLDGTGLRRVTPLDNPVVAPYYFPATGVAAYRIPSGILPNGRALHE